MSRNTRSSFAQSFFQSGSDVGSDDGSNNFPIPSSRPPTRRPSTRRSRLKSSDSLSASEVAAAAAVAAEAFHETEERGSWYADALLQGNEANLHEFFAQQDQGTTFGNQEVLEQYRIMAQFEARHRVKENIGFDMDEYEATHKLSNHDATDKKALFGSKKSKHRLPEPKRITPNSIQLQLEAPPLLPPRPDPKLVKQKCKRAVPELENGSIVSRGENVPANHHTVKCLGCRCSLHVHMVASLVRCPECKVISPASSTRR